MSAYIEAVKYAMIFFMVTMAIEWLIGKLLKKSIYQPMDTISSISSGMTNNIKSILKLSVVIVSYQWMYEHLALLKIDANWWVYVVAFLGIDFAYYWTHRWNHEYNILWNKHIIHHSSEEYNLACALRQSISDVVQIYFFLYLPMALIGIPPKVINILLPIHLFAQFWYHTRLIGKMGFLENIIVTPSHHRVHHAINDKYIDKNYSSIFIFWDFIFGTFQEEIASEPPVYGIKKPARTWNPILINFMHITQLIKDAYRTKKWSNKFKLWFMPTGWRPDDIKDLYPIEIIEDPYSYNKYETAKDHFITLWSSFQLVVHLAMQFHLIYLISYLNVNLDFNSSSIIEVLIQFKLIFLYGLFFILSVWAYTSLMDRAKFSIIMEISKSIIGFLMVVNFPDLMHISEGIIIPKYGIYSYLIISIIINLYYLLFFNNEKKVSLVGQN
jgi:sterol desaturase/sphingolipid hydroxylase (fatty acid hydroxylase superfamily)